MGHGETRGGLGLGRFLRGGGECHGGIRRGRTCDTDGIAVDLGGGDAVESHAVPVGDVVIVGIGNADGDGRQIQTILRQPAAVLIGEAVRQGDADLIGLEAEIDQALRVQIGLVARRSALTYWMLPVQASLLIWTVCPLAEGPAAADADIGTAAESSGADLLRRVLQIQVVVLIVLIDVVLDDGAAGQGDGMVVTTDKHAAATVIDGVVLNGAAAHAEAALGIEVHTAAIAATAIIVPVFVLIVGQTGEVVADLAASHVEGACHVHAAAEAATEGGALLIVDRTGVVAGDAGGAGEVQRRIQIHIHTAAAVKAQVVIGAVDTVAADLAAGEVHRAAAALDALDVYTAAEGVGDVILDGAAAHIQGGAGNQNNGSTGGSIGVGGIIAADLAAIQIHRGVLIIHGMGLIAGDLAAAEVEGTPVGHSGGVRGAVFGAVQTGDLAAEHIKFAAGVDLYDAGTLGIRRVLAGDLTGLLGAVGDGQGMIVRHMNVWAIIPVFQNDIVSVEADPHIIQIAAPPLIGGGHIIEQIVAAVALDGLQAADADPLGVLIVVVVGAIALVLQARAVDVLLIGQQVQIEADGPVLRDGAVGAVTGKHIGIGGAPHDAIGGDQIGVEADAGVGGNIACKDGLILRRGSHVQVAGGLVVPLRVAGDIHCTGYLAGGHTTEVHTAAGDSGGVAR